jgi:hypothetical protein
MRDPDNWLAKSAVSAARHRMAVAASARRFGDRRHCLGRLFGDRWQQEPDENVAAIIASAKTSLGVSLVGLECDALMAIADDVYRAAGLTRPKSGRSATIGSSLPRTLHHGGSGRDMRENRERLQLCSTRARKDRASPGAAEPP